VTDVVYVKGALFLKSLEETFGRDRLDPFLRSYFRHFAFQSVSSEDFVGFLKSNLLDQLPVTSPVSKKEVLASIHEWIYGSDLPASALKLDSRVLEMVKQEADAWVKNQSATAKLQTSSWSVEEWIHFLKCISEKVTSPKMLELDNAFGLTSSRNSEIIVEWLLLSIKKDYKKAFPRLEEFLSTVGRNKYLKPLYTELAKTQKGEQRAISIYTRVRPTYHPITRAAIDPILNWKEKPGDYGE
jgi:leukotriene-A4 hydrolase